MTPTPVTYTITPLPLDRFRVEVLAMYEPPMRAKGTRDKVRLVLDLLAAQGVASTAEFTPEMVSRFIAARPPGESANTTHGIVNQLRVLCNYAAAREYCRSSPFALRKSWVRKSPQSRTKHHSRSEIARVLALLESEAEERRGWAGWRARRLYALVATVAYTGIRRNEALYLQAGDVDIDNRMIALVSRERNRLKTVDSAQPVPIPEALASILGGWLGHRLDDHSAEDGHPRNRIAPRGECPWLFPNLTGGNNWTGGPPGQRPDHRLHYAGEKAGVEGFTFLSLRHSFATHAEFWGLSTPMLQRILRHSTALTQHHYRHADAVNMRAAVRDIRFDSEPGQP